MLQQYDNGGAMWLERAANAGHRDAMTQLGMPRLLVEHTAQLRGDGEVVFRALPNSATRLHKATSARRASTPKTRTGRSNPI
jgi:hypothetical protein